ncbi:MAG: hypothetical protein E4H10_16330 [Bacteroidia bacterium]|nr:MAG: hypothetical protein E4H10_16330 [Bacteroidia bacterium]
MELQVHYRSARLVFWFAQVIGVAMIVALLIFIGGTLISEILDKLIIFREDYMVYILFLFELLITGAFILSWYRRRNGAILIIVLSIVISILWGKEGLNFVLIHLPLLFSGLLLLFYSYYKEWILKQKA